MKIRIDWYKRYSGKWYSGQEIEISGINFFYSDEFKQEIVDNQTELKDGWQDDCEFIVVTGDLQKYDFEPRYGAFYHHLFYPNAFEGIKKTNK